MATKAYLRSASYAGWSGTFPSGEQDAASPTVSLTGAATLREAVLSEVGASMTFLTGSSSASSSAQSAFIGMWALAPLSGAQTVGGASETITVNVADYESNLSANYCVNRAHVYVWRPSTNSKVGDCCSYATAPSSASSEATSANSVQVSKFVVDLASVSADDGDVIVVELWASFTQAAATAYTIRMYYDGSTETTVENTVVADHAAFVEFTQTFTLDAPESRLTQQYGLALYEDSVASDEARLTQQYGLALYEDSVASPEARLTQQYAIVFYDGNLTRLPGSGSLVYTGKTPALSISSGEAITISPLPGSVIYAGQQPTEAQTWSVSPSSGNELYSGQQPTEAQTWSVSPSAGNKLYSGQQPVESQTWSVSPIAGNELYSGQQPAAALTTETNPFAGNELYSGQQPDEAQTWSVSPSSGNELYTGRPPTEAQTWSVSSSAGNELYSGQQPTGSQTWSTSPSAGNELYSGQQPYEAQTWSVSPSSGNELYLGQQPYEAQTWSSSPLSGNLIYGGQMPFLVTHYYVSPFSGVVVYTGFSPSLGSIVFPYAGELIYTGQSPGIGASVFPTAGAIVYVGASPSLQTSLLTINGVCHYTGMQPYEAQTWTTSPSSGSLVYNGNNGIIRVNALYYSAAEPTIIRWPSYTVLVVPSNNRITEA